MSAGRKRNRLNLSITPVVPEESADGTEAQQQQDFLEMIIDKQLESLVLSPPQIERMNEWLALKRKVVGELNEDMFERICELGQGNAGVVHKMRHLESGTIMARKLVHVEVKPSTQAQILKELEVLHNANSPYIVGKSLGGFCK
jgi:hypothetical protein